MTIKGLLETDCKDVDEILLRMPAKSKKKNKKVRPLWELVKGERGGN